MRFTTAVLLVLGVFARAPGGDLESRDFCSETLDQSMKVNVVLPDGYKDDENRRYPVIYLLHGYGGDYREWEKVGVVGETAKLPVIIVMPEGDRSFYVNHHEDAKARWEDYVTRDVVAFVDKSFRTHADRERRAISGLSMGGYGAMALGLRHPELFASVASHSGALGVPGTAISGEIGERLRQIFGPDGSKARQDYDILKLVKDLPAERRPHLYIDCGSRDFLLDSNRKFVAHLSSLGVDYEYRELPGTHNFQYWKANVRYSVTRQLEALESASAAKKAAPAVAPAVAGASVAPAGLVGSWNLVLKLEDNDLDYGLKIKEAEGKLKATLISPRSGEHEVRAISFEGGNLKMEIDRTLEGNPVTFVYEGKLEGGKLSGKVQIKDFPDFSGEWSAERKEKE